jgi:hypothetical protein
MSLIKFDKDGNISVPNGFTRWRRPVDQVTVHIIDQSGGISLAKVATLGVFGLGRKTKATFVFATDTGETCKRRLEGSIARSTLEWAVQFNAWREATQSR